MHPSIDIIVETFSQKGRLRYGHEQVTQLEHALQSASLAEKDQASDQLVVAALLHDIGHILNRDQLPVGLNADLHDMHEEIGYHWLMKTFGKDVAEPVRLHVEAKRYLCTKDPSYMGKLTPTSLKSFHDQGGMMDHEEQKAFEFNPYFEDALSLRKWDDLAKEIDAEVNGLEHYFPCFGNCLADHAESEGNS